MSAGGGRRRRVAARSSVASGWSRRRRLPDQRDDEKALRRGLRAKRRQLGDEGESVELLLSECAYEQWHRLLFARFLAENGLLIHPEYRAPVTLAECASSPPSWASPMRGGGGSLRGRDPAGDLPPRRPLRPASLAPEVEARARGDRGRAPAEVFTSDDGLGWVYQYWQREKKDEVNASERKIGGADLGPVTQLFTENYMVRFLLENSLGAWWASRHPESPLVEGWEYLRFDERASRPPDPSTAGPSAWPR